MRQYRAFFIVTPISECLRHIKSYNKINIIKVNFDIKQFYLISFWATYYVSIQNGQTDKILSKQ